MNILNHKMSKYAVECDWNSKISESLRSLDLFCKEMGILEKNLIFLQKKTGKGGKFAVRCVSNDVISWNFFPP